LLAGLLQVVARMLDRFNHHCRDEVLPYFQRQHDSSQGAATNEGGSPRSAKPVLLYHADSSLSKEDTDAAVSLLMAQLMRRWGHESPAVVARIAAGHTSATTITRYGEGSGSVEASKAGFWS
jgi:hypothetical protein